MIKIVVTFKPRIAKFIFIVIFVLGWGCNFSVNLEVKIQEQDFNYLVKNLYKKTLDPFITATFEATRRASFIERVLDTKNNLRCDLYMLQVASRRRKCQVAKNYKVFSFLGGFTSLSIKKIKKISSYHTVIHEVFFPTKTIKNIFTSRDIPFKQSNGLKSIVIDFNSGKSSSLKASQVPHLFTIYSPTGQTDNFFLAYFLESLYYMQQKCKAKQDFRVIFFEHYASIKKYLKVLNLYNGKLLKDVLVPLKKNFLVTMNSALKIESILPQAKRVLKMGKFDKAFAQKLINSLMQKYCI